MREIQIFTFPYQNSLSFLPPLNRNLSFSFFGHFDWVKWGNCPFQFVMYLTIKNEKEITQALGIRTELEYARTYSSAPTCMEYWDYKLECFGGSEFPWGNDNNLQFITTTNSNFFNFPSPTLMIQDIADPRLNFSIRKSLCCSWV